MELTSRLIDHVDDATRAVVRARLSIYPADAGGDHEQVAARRIRHPTAGW